MNLKKFQDFLAIQKERQLAMQELSEVLGVDISFSEQEVFDNAMEEYGKYLDKYVMKEVDSWMKSAFS
jgi:hypothetical protein